MLTTAQNAYQAFLDKQKALDYNFEGMTSEQQDAEMLEYTKLKIAATQEQVKNANFIADRQAAFTALDEEYQVKRVALQVEWQAREDALV